MDTHPIVNAYLNTNEPIYQILKKHYDKNNFFDLVFYEVVEEVNSKDLKTELLLKIDKAVMEGHPNPNYYMLFIVTSILYLGLYNQFEKANSLCSIGNSLSHEKINTIIKAYFIQAQSRLNRYEGNIIQSIKYLDESMALIRKTDFRYNVFWVNYSASLGYQGKLKEYGKYPDGLTEPFSEVIKYRDLESRLVNCLQTCNTQEGLPLFQELKAYTETNSDSQIYRFTIYQDLIKIIMGDFFEGSYESKPFQLLANCNHALSIGKIEEAIKYHQALLACDWPKAYIKNFVEYLPIHFELCLGKKGMAKYLLQEKIKKGDVNYLDDLFIGRVLLLENDWEGANDFFARLLENINKYDASKRLQYELQFAKEMKLSNVMALLNGLFSIEKKTNQKFKAENIYIPNIDDKGVKAFIGNSETIKGVKNLIKKYANIKSPILVTGETGTGKELVAKAIHEEGLFAKQPFLAINCGALTDSLLQSELFGYVEGAFTGAQKARKGIFEAAGKGTVFLDEFGDISPKLQVSLLRVLEANEIRLIGGTKTINIECKIVIATNVDLHRAVVAEKFREDLFFRLARFEIKLPALRERKEDIPELINHFLWVGTKDENKPKTLSPELLSTLVSYRWPGNIRELKNEIDRLCVLNPNIDHLGLEHFDKSHFQEDVSTLEKNLSLDEPFYPMPTNQNILNIIQKGFPIEQRHSQLKKLFQQYKKLTRSQIMEITKVGPSTATKDLLVLQNAGYIIRRSPTKSPRTDYFEFIEKT